MLDLALLAVLVVAVYLAYQWRKEDKEREEELKGRAGGIREVRQQKK